MSRQISIFKLDWFGWVAIAVGAAFYALNFRSLLGGVERMASLASALGSKLSWQTKICYVIGDPWLAVIPIVLLAVPILVMLRARNPKIKIIATTALSGVAIVYVTVARIGLSIPFEQAGELIIRNL